MARVFLCPHQNNAAVWSLSQLFTLVFSSLSFVNSYTPNQCFIHLKKLKSFCVKFRLHSRCLNNSYLNLWRRSCVHACSVEASIVVKIFLFPYTVFFFIVVEECHSTMLKWWSLFIEFSYTKDLWLSVSIFGMHMQKFCYTQALQLQCHRADLEICESEDNSEIMNHDSQTTWFTFSTSSVATDCPLITLIMNISSSFLNLQYHCHTHCHCSKNCCCKHYNRSWIWLSSKREANYSTLFTFGEHFDVFTHLLSNNDWLEVYLLVGMWRGKVLCACATSSPFHNCMWVLWKLVGWKKHPCITCIFSLLAFS